MANGSIVSRPPFAEALASWKALLRLNGLPEELIWVFEENLCFEKDAAAPAGFRLGYQIDFTPPPPEAVEIAYEHFGEFDAPLVFYRVGSSRGRSVCLVLGDKWFETKTEGEGFSKRGDWQMLFHLGPAREIEEIKERTRWERRVLRDRPLHDLDFCMTLQAVHETLAHGRVLTAYDRYALKFLHSWRRFLGQSD